MRKKLIEYLKRNEVISPRNKIDDVDFNEFVKEMRKAGMFHFYITTHEDDAQRLLASIVFLETPDEKLREKFEWWLEYLFGSEYLITLKIKHPRFKPLEKGGVDLIDY